MKKFNLSFKLALISQVISLLGGNVLRVTLLLFILDFTMSAEVQGLATAISAMPFVLFAIPGGIIADRMNRKKSIVALDAAKAAISAGLLIIFLNGAYTVPILITFITVFAVLVTLFGPILTSAIPTIVDEGVLVEANGMIQIINGASMLLAFPIAGFLYATIGVSNIIILCGISFLISTIIDLFIEIPFRKPKYKAGVGQDVKESFRYMTKENPLLLKVAVMFAILSLLFVPIFGVAFPYIIRIEFGASDIMFGIAQGFAALGMLAGSLLSGKVKKWLKVEYFSSWILGMSILCLFLGFAVYSPLFFGSTFVPFWLFNVGMLLIMVIVAFGNIIVMANVQEQAPAHLLGKVVALVLLIANITPPIGNYLFGWAMETLAERVFILFIVVAATTFITALIGKKMFQNMK